MVSHASGAEHFDRRTWTSAIPGLTYVFELDDDGTARFPFVSEGCAELYGFTAEEAMADASLMHHAIHREDRGSFFDAGWRSARDEGEFIWRGRVTRPDDDVRHVTIASRAARTASGYRWAGLVMEEPASDERDSEAMETMVDRDSAIDRSVDVLAVLGHEIATPLTSVIGYAEEALDVVDSDRLIDRRFVRRALELVVYYGRHLDAIQRDLLALPTFDAGQLRATPAGVVVADHLDHARSFSRHPDSLSVSCEAWVTCWVQPSHLEQILTNLILNADRYADGAHTLNAFSVDGVTWIVIEDAGEGIPEDKRSRLFQRFERLGRTEDSGTGLGLFIAHELAKANAGTLTYEPATPRGSRFVLTLPSGPPDTI